MHSILHGNLWRIQEFQNRGARSRRRRNFGSGVCFDAPSHLHYVFLVIIGNKIHIVNIVCRLHLKYICVLHKQPPKKIQTGGRAPGAPVLDPPLVINFLTVVTKLGGIRWLVVVDNATPNSKRYGRGLHESKASIYTCTAY